MEEFHFGLIAFQNPQDKANFTKAEQIFKDFPNRPDAWEILSQVLTSDAYLEGNKVSAYIHAARMLMVRIERHLTTLNAQQQLQLRDLMLQSVVRLTATRRPEIQSGVRYICRALANLCIQLVETQDSIPFFFQNLEQQNHLELLAMLAAVPNQILDKRSPAYQALTSDRNRDRYLQVFKVFGAHTGRVFKYLNTVAQNIPSQPQDNNEQILQLQRHVIQCFSAWIDMQECKVEELEGTHRLIELAFTWLGSTDPSLSEDSMTCCLALIKFVNSQAGESHTSTRMYLIQRTIALKEYLPRIFSDIDAHEDLARNLAMVATEAGDAFLTYSEITQESMHILELIIQCSTVPSYRISEISHQFWFVFFDELHQHDDNEGSKASSDPFKDPLRVFRNKIFATMRLPNDYLELADEDQDEIKNWRTTTSSLFRQVSGIIGDKETFNLLREALAKSLQTYQQTKAWQDVEVPVFVYRALRLSLRNHPEESKQFVTAIGQLPDHPLIKRQVLFILGGISDWVRENQAALPDVLKYIIMGFNDANTIDASGRSLNEICASNYNTILENPQILDLLLTAYDQLFKLAPKIDSENNEKDWVAIEDTVKGICKEVLSRGGLPIVQPRLLGLIKPAADQLYDSLQQKDFLTKESPSNKKLKNSLRILSFVIKTRTGIYLEGNERSAFGQQLTPVFGELWTGVLRDIFIKCQKDGVIMERATDVVKQVVRGYPDAFQQHLMMVLETFGLVFRESMHSSFLYFASVIVAEYSRKPEALPLVQQLYSVFAESALVYLQKDGLGDPEIVEDFFRLVSRYLEMAPTVLLQSQSIDPIVDLAIVCLEIQNRESSKCVTTFLENLLVWVRPSEVRRHQEEALDQEALQNLQANTKVIEALIIKYGEKAVVKMLSLLNSMPSFVVPNYAKIIEGLYKLNKNALHQWMLKGLQTLPDMANNVKEIFIRDYFAEVNPRARDARSSSGDGSVSRLDALKDLDRRLAHHRAIMR